jgi:hypothetical protein
MKKIDNIISIIMVFVTAIGLSRAFSMSPVKTVFLVVAAFVLYEVILNVANNNPSIRTMLYVTLGFIFGLSLTIIVRFDKGWVSAIICLLCMGYKYMMAEASVTKRSRSRNIFVVVVNAFFYACMFTVVEGMVIGGNSALYIMIYVASFAFFMCSYVAYKRLEPPRPAYVHGNRESINVDNDWQHIVKRTVNYGRELKAQFEDALDKSGDTFSGLIDELRKKIVPDYSSSEEADDEIRTELDEYRKEITLIAAKEDLDDNEMEILDRISKEFDEIYYDYYRVGAKPQLEYETKISLLANDIEMLKNTIHVRKLREEEDRMNESQQSRRSRAQQARRKREREERERKEREAEEARKKERQDDLDEEIKREYEKAVEEEKRRREEERKRQEKRRRERNAKTYTGDRKKKDTDSYDESAGKSRGDSSGSGKEGSGKSRTGSRSGSGKSADGSHTGGKSGNDNTSSTVAGIETIYFKGCTSLDELSLRYKKLCLIYHPDSGNGDVDTYIELKDEYELLKKRLS